MPSGMPMLMGRQGFEDFILSLPAASIVRQWRDDSVGKVGGRIFALLDRDPGDIWFKASDMAFDLLQEMDGIRPAPYFARAKWLAVSAQSGLTDADLGAYLREAHRLVALRLSRKQRAELGLSGLSVAPDKP